MAIITIDIPTVALTRVVDSLCLYGGYQATITNPDGTTSPNPVTKAKFAKAEIIKFIKQVTKNNEASVSANTARQTKETEIESFNII